jgi:hypothetical protein
MTNADLLRVTRAFPNLRGIDCDRWSEPSYVYNCIAWAAEDVENWWWPVAGGLKPGYWPAGVPREETVAAFLQAFETLGYAVCTDGCLEFGFTKIALYAQPTPFRRPTHMARQLPEGIWTSKLGPGPDILHETLECLEGRVYGTVAVILRRPIS